jgi:hypothetical protein
MKQLTVVCITLILLLINVSTYAQNCTVNAGVDQTLCYNQGVTLTATTAGNLNASPNYQ